MGNQTRSPVSTMRKRNHLGSARPGCKSRPILNAFQDGAGKLDPCREPWTEREEDTGSNIVSLTHPDRTRTRKTERDVETRAEGE